MHPDDRAAVPPEPTTDARSLTDRRFTAIVRALGHDDPRFVRRLSRPAPGGLSRADLLIIVAVLGTLLEGVVPLGLGIHLHAAVLLAVGTAGCLLAPTLVPWLLRGAILRFRPLWT